MWSKERFHLSTLALSLEIPKKHAYCTDLLESASKCVLKHNIAKNVKFHLFNYGSLIHFINRNAMQLSSITFL